MARASIIIPTFDRPHLLSRAVESARAAAEDVEIIVIDDASVDETSSLCRELTGIKYIRLEHNQGVAGARNVGILASTSEYVAFLDDECVTQSGLLLAAGIAAGFELRLAPRLRPPDEKSKTEAPCLRAPEVKCGETDRPGEPARKS